MSSRAPFDSDDARSEIDAAFVARLAGVAPRSTVDAAALHYEAGYREGLSSSGRELRIYRGLTIGSAALLALTIGLWASGGRKLSVAVDVAATHEASADASAQDLVPPTPEQAVAPIAEVVAAPDPIATTRAERPAERRARTTLERRYLANGRQLDDRAIRWKDLYDHSLSPFSVSVPRPATTSPEVSSPSSDPWSAMPSAQRVQDLIEGI